MTYYGTLLKLMNKSVENLHTSVRTHESASDICRATCQVVNFMDGNFGFPTKKVNSIIPDGAPAAQAGGKMIFQEYELLRGKVLRCLCHIANLDSEKAFADATLRKELFEINNALNSHYKHSMINHDCLHKMCDLCDIKPKQLLQYDASRWADYEKPFETLCELHEPIMMEHSIDRKTGKMAEYRKKLQQWKDDCDQWAAMCPAKNPQNANKSQTEMQDLLSKWEDDIPTKPTASSQILRCM